MTFLYSDILDAIRGKNVDLRHDVDICLEDCLMIAQDEKNHGLSSTYYIRHDSDYYNLFSHRSKSVMFNLKEMGHELGLHVDASYIRDELDLKRYIKEALGIFKFKKFTFHINSDFTKSFKKESYSGIQNKSIVGTYISDSNNSFNQDKMQRLLNEDNYTLCLHPEWWVRGHIHTRFISKSEGIIETIFEELTDKCKQEIIRD